MLELYHHGSSVCAAKVRFAMAEKHLHVDKYHYVDILKGEQFSPEYLNINPRAVVPTLVHDGRVIAESTLICEYVDEVFDGPALQPEDAYDRYRMRTWTKAVDELLHPACAEVTYVSCHRHILMRQGKEALEAQLEKTPEVTVKGSWRQRKRELIELGFEAPGVDAKLRLYDEHLKAMENALGQSNWLAGKKFSLADVAMAPYLTRLEMLGMSELWTARLPNVHDWFRRIKDRPTYAPSFLDWCPDELMGDLLTYGTRSWPGVKAILSLD